MNKITRPTSRLDDKLDYLKERANGFPHRVYILPFRQTKMSPDYFGNSFPDIHFLVVPLIGMTCWGFEEKEHLDLFLNMQPDNCDLSMRDYITDGSHIEHYLAE